MAIPVNSIIEVAAIGTILGQTTMNVFHFVVDIADSTPDRFVELGNLLTEHFSANVATYGSTLIACCPGNWTFSRATAQVIYPVRERRVQQSRALPGGRQPADQPNVQASVTYSTDLAGRNQIGGKRVCMTPVDSELGFLNATLAGALTQFAIKSRTFISMPVTGGSYSPVIFHRSPNATPRFQRITGSFIQNTTRVIRRRTVGLGI